MDLRKLGAVKMGAIAAAFSKRGTDAPSKVLTMLRELQHRATIDPRVFGHPSAFIAQSIGQIDDEKTRSEIAVGTNNSEPVLGRNYIWIFEGHHFPTTPSTIHSIMHQSNWQPPKIARLVLKKLDGSYAFMILLADKAILGRDMMGLQPLYFGENQDTYGVASERKALWKVGIVNAMPFPPGNMATMDRSGFAFEPVAELKSQVQEEVEITKAAKRLRGLLVSSTVERVSDVDRVAVAFSGGLDSSVVAYVAKLGSGVQLICVTLSQEEAETAKDAAKMLGLPITVMTYSISDVEEVLPKILWLIEEPDAMKVGVAMPFFWTSEVASKLGYRVLLAGQSADELFGGYQRYLRQYAAGEATKLRDSLFHDVAGAYRTNFQRDEPVCAFHKVELRLPFTDRDVVAFALTLPARLNVESARDDLRKRILRQTAKDLGIPDSIAERPKRAIQFSTGVDKALRHLARREGLTLSCYIAKMFNKVHPSVAVKND